MLLSPCNTDWDNVPCQYTRCRVGLMSQRQLTVHKLNTCWTYTSTTNMLLQTGDPCPKDEDMRRVSHVVPDYTPNQTDLRSRNAAADTSCYTRPSA